MKLECINNSYVEIVNDDGSKYYLSGKKFLEIIEEQKNQVENNKHYPYMYGTKELKEFYENYPECCI